MDNYLIVGLGNPGFEYEKTKHNVGFMAIDKLCNDLSIFLSNSKFEGYYNHVVKNDCKFFIAKPMTFMNNSGFFVSQFANFFKIPKSNIIVLYDDINLDVGKIRIRSKGSSGGQNGIKNIISQLGTEDIKRIKIGIGKPKHDLVSHVLSNFKPDDFIPLNDALNKSKHALLDFMKDQKFDFLMNKYNS